MQSRASARECITRWPEPASELDIRPQFDYTRSLVRGVGIVVRRYSPKAKAAPLNKWELVSGGSAIVIAARARSLLEIRMIKNIQHFCLEREAHALANWEALREGHVIVPILRPI